MPIKELVKILLQILGFIDKAQDQYVENKLKEKDNEDSKALHQALGEKPDAQAVADIFNNKPRRKPDS